MCQVISDSLATSYRSIELQVQLVRVGAKKFEHQQTSFPQYMEVVPLQATKQRMRGAT